MTRPTTLAAAVLVALTVAASAHSQYKARGFLRTGYSDQQVAPDRWDVRGSSHDEGGSIPVALYRAAQIATAAGIAELRVVKQKVTTERMVRRSDGSTVALTEKTQLTVRAIRTDADRAACEMPEARRCLTLPVAGLMAAYGPRLGMPAARAGETPAPPVSLMSSRLGEPLPPSWQAGRTSPLMDLLLGAARRRSGKPAVPAASMPPVAEAVHAPMVSVRGTALPARPAGAVARPTLPFVERVSVKPLPLASLPVGAAAPRPMPQAQAAAEPAGYEDLLRAAQPVSSDPRQGWTASE